MKRGAGGLIWKRFAWILDLTAYSIVAYFREQRKWNLGQQATQFYNFCSETLGHLACSVDYKHKCSHIKLVPRAARLPEKKMSRWQTRNWEFKLQDQSRITLWFIWSCFDSSARRLLAPYPTLSWDFLLEIFLKDCWISLRLQKIGRPHNICVTLVQI